MSKCVISNRIFLDATAAQMESLSEQLTYTIPPPIPTQLPTVIKTFSKLSPKVCSIPVGRTDLIPKGYEIIDKRILVPVTFPEFKFQLRDSQQEVYDAVNDNAIINAPVSWGKTFTAIALAKKLGQKTLIITHNTILRDQWAKEVANTLGIEVGIVGSSTFNTTPIIVVGNVQTVTKNASKLATLFGTVILDEMHHVSASTFSKIIDQSKARFKIGLSGTLVRKDKKHVLFQDYFGGDVLKPEKENYMHPKVAIVKTNYLLPSERAWATRVTALEVGNKEYQKTIANLADSAARAGHKVLVVGSRVEFLSNCQALTIRPSCAITGATKLDAREALLSKLNTPDLDIIFGTLSIFSEGISQSSLSCLILATPINNESLLTQVIGRICRLKEGKKTPLIVDVHLKGTTVPNQQQERLRHYLENGYEISHI